ncbi:hypothetical protein TUN199_09930 [Pyrenophora tritici-repentis]|nr:hypothetical protein PtrV1_13269 [Pyrenophora tritici-repentis]KAI0573806.1 hypothetical protein Alg130_09945 [Pyrenophora tritici-repentis]KAI0576428.1 hypothetical protein Alg215_07486 [Pyrenophora tritici-repentis]KAI0605893.1 hypothetical protein TUN205_09856 [Pyrenophora tritici-repentis]KAI0618074.1 hypothetical protein TUN199_09930 [Pyrenophora tritici-repentis]
MKVSQFLTCFVAAQAITAASIPETNNALHALEERRVVPPSELLSPEHTLERRKGGGGRGGGSSSGGSGGGRTSGSSSGGGGRTSSGSGAPRSFGAAQPYRAGSRTPGKGLVAGALILPAAMLFIMPGLWLASGRNETLPVMCLCQENSSCGCDENDGDYSYVDDLVGNGSYPALDKSLVTVSDVNGTKTLVLNGTLPEGTTAPGSSAAVDLKVGKYTGYYVVGVMVLAGVFM